MQEKIYRFVVRRSLHGGVYAAKDTAKNMQVMLYGWTPAIEERQRAGEALAAMSGALGCEVFSAGASFYLVAATGGEARRALETLHRSGLFAGVEAEGEAAPAPPPPSPPFVEVKTGGDGGVSPGGPVLVSDPPRGPRDRLKGLVLTMCALLGIAVAGVSYYASTTAKPEPAPLVGPTLTVQPARASVGDRVNLQWSSSGYERVQLDGQRIDNAGNRIEIARRTHTFRVAAFAADGTMRTAEATLLVSPGHSRAGKPSAGGR